MYKLVVQCLYTAWCTYVTAQNVACWERDVWHRFCFSLSFNLSLHHYCLQILYTTNFLRENVCMYFLVLFYSITFNNTYYRMLSSLLFYFFGDFIATFYGGFLCTAITFAISLVHRIASSAFAMLHFFLQ